MPDASVTGLDLAEAFYREVVAQLVAVPHAACLLGEGSEVLGFDDDRSRDHEWGPRVQLLVAPEHVAPVRARIGDGLPPNFRGFDTAWFSLAAGAVTHHVEVTTFGEWIAGQLGFDPTDGPDLARWLGTPQQRLLQVTAGRVFRDDAGELTRVRELLSWYPPDVWRWMIMGGWHLIGGTEPLRGRCLETGDALGARLLTARLCRLIMEMAFLQERRYHPYEKWFGSAFRRLDPAPTLAPLLDTAVSGGASGAATAALAEALIALGHRHNSLEISRPVAPAVQPFKVNINDAVRPYQVINATDYIQATRDAITDPALRALVHVGAIDQLSLHDDTTVNFTSWPQHLTEAFRRELHAASGQR